MTYYVSDLVTRIRNGQQARKPSIECLNNQRNRALLKVLIKEGIVLSFKEKPKTNKRFIQVFLKYINYKAIGSIICVSRPTRRVYTPVHNLIHYRKGLGFLVLATPNGLLTTDEAIAQNVGGEILCKIF